ncbi:hypothetical protein Pelo_9767 [Pelomyxa schiedti]|nr:hypothetical protein Pelo_9767 [Pelomyxa schiedti]
MSFVKSHLPLLDPTSPIYSPLIEFLIRGISEVLLIHNTPVFSTFRFSASYFFRFFQNVLSMFTGVLEGIPHLISASAACIVALPPFLYDNPFDLVHWTRISTNHVVQQYLSIKVEELELINPPPELVPVAALSFVLCICIQASTLHCEIVVPTTAKTGVSFPPISTSDASLASHVAGSALEMLRTHKNMPPLVQQILGSAVIASIKKHPKATLLKLLGDGTCPPDTSAIEVIKPLCDVMLTAHERKKIVDSLAPCYPESWSVVLLL